MKDGGDGCDRVAELVGGNIQYLCSDRHQNRKVICGHKKTLLHMEISVREGVYSWFMQRI